jgi:methionine biosynthesis protein MetW
MQVQEQLYEDYWRCGGHTIGYCVFLKQDILRREVKSGCSVLDVGCGDGFTASVIASSCQVTGVDVSETALHKAEENGLKTIKFNLDDGLPEVNQKHDVVLLLDVLEHVHNPEKLLDAALSKLSENGIIIVSVPNTMNLLTRLFFLFGRYVDLTDISHKGGKLFSEHLHIFSKKKLEELLSSRKLQIEKRFYYFPKKFNEKSYIKLQLVGDLVYKTKLYEILPSLFSLEFIYKCRSK